MDMDELIDCPKCFKNPDFSLGKSPNDAIATISCCGYSVKKPSNVASTVWNNYAVSELVKENLPCPFCSSSASPFSELGGSAGHGMGSKEYVGIRCNSCGIESRELNWDGYISSMSKAWLRWNKRCK